MFLFLLVVINYYISWRYASIMADPEDEAAYLQSMIAQMQKRLSIIQKSNPNSELNINNAKSQPSNNNSNNEKLVKTVYNPWKNLYNKDLGNHIFKVKKEGKTIFLELNSNKKNDQLLRNFEFGTLRKIGNGKNGKEGAVLIQADFLHDARVKWHKFRYEPGIYRTNMTPNILPSDFQIGNRSIQTCIICRISYVPDSYIRINFSKSWSNIIDKFASFLIGTEIMNPKIWAFIGKKEKMTLPCMMTFRWEGKSLMLNSPRQIQIFGTKKDNWRGELYVSARSFSDGIKRTGLLTVQTAKRNNLYNCSRKSQLYQEMKRLSEKGITSGKIDLQVAFSPDLHGD